MFRPEKTLFGNKMYLEPTVLIVLIAIFNVRCDTEISDEEYQKLPAVFHIDPYTKCVQENKQYCKILIKLAPRNDKEPSRVWQLIEVLKKSKNNYKHDVLHHAICVDDFCKKIYSSANITAALTQCYNENFEEIGVVAQISQIDCKNYDKIYKIGSYDLVFLCLVIGYVFLTVCATLHDFKTPESEKTHKYLIIFSTISNWAKIKADSRKTNFQKLTFVQGIRFYTTALIILCHTVCSFVGGFVEDTKYVEDVPKNFLRRFLTSWFVFLVQTYFLLSAWFLSYHSFQIFQQSKKINPFKYVVLTFINRYLRIILLVTVMIMVAYSTLPYTMLFNGPVKELYSDAEYLRCQKTWWMTIGCINNRYGDDMCYFITWYLSADTQLYLLSLIVLILAWRFPSNIKIIFGICIVAGIVITGTITFIYELDVIFRDFPEYKSIKYCKFNSFNFYVSYSSTYANMPTYMLGLVFGNVYFKFEETKDFSTLKSIVAKWWPIFAIFPLSAVVLACFEYGPATTALLSGVLKPMYAFGIGISILGMSQETNGITKQFFEWRPGVFLGNCTYAAYIVQIITVFHRTAVAEKLMRVSDYIILFSFAQDVILTFLAGFLLHIFIEMPALQLQSLLVPKIRQKAPKNL